jgi:hypothetical protein
VNDGPAAGIAPRAAIAHSIHPAGGVATQGALAVVSVARRPVDRRARATNGTVCVLLRDRPPTPWLECDAEYRPPTPPATTAFRVDGLGNVLATRHSRNGNPASPFHAHTYWGAQLATIERDDLAGPPPQAGARSEELFNEYDAGNVMFMGTTRRVFNGTVWEPVHEVASRSFWSADERLVVHQRYSGGFGGGNTEGVYEEYRYDALGRRILVRTRRDGLCSGHTACHGAITRFVWDGAVLLFEMRAPGAHSVTAPALEATTGTGPYYGRVAYVHGPELDKPLAIIRGADPAGFIVPHRNWRGLYDRATTATGAHFTAAIDWPGLTPRSYHGQDLDSKPEGAWYGSLILDQKDATGLLYRRNRYCDPASGRVLSPRKTPSGWRVG